ncbi:MAG: GGDEF domain-containing protein [Proteobacteria bacterium]|nr:GGDEF domain-containing protein [Pseudomonadota bacterium]
MKKSFISKLLLLAALASLAGVFGLEAMAAPYMAPTAAADRNTVRFPGVDAVIDLKRTLLPYKAPSGPEADGSAWFMMTAVNDSVRPASRILIADQPPSSGLHFFPRRARPTIRQVASSEAGVAVESARAYGRHVYRVIIPPATSVAIAIRLANADERPSVLAWTESALVEHNRQLAIFVAAVAGLLFAAFAITAGLAIMTGHSAPRWGAGVLGAAFLAHLSSTGIFDDAVTAVGGPYGLTAMLAGLALAAGFRLTDTVVPIESIWPRGRRWVRWITLAIVTVSLLAFLGVPGATLVVDTGVVIGAAALAGFIVDTGRRGRQAARVIAPGAVVFALVAAAAALAAFGAFQDNPMAPAIVGGFAAAGAVLLALSIAAGEGITIVPALRVAQIAMPPLSATPQSEAKTAKNEQTAQMLEIPAALQAIGASHQGVFELDFRRDVVKLSSEAAVLIGFTDGAQEIAHISWIARVHQDDRDVYKAALLDYRGHPGLAFRIEFRVRSESGRYPWFELRATMMGEGTQAARCLGLMADVTTRKESEAAVVDRTLKDPLTGLGNRVALMEELELLGDGLKHATFALLDIDRFKSIHASLGDDGGDDVLTGVAERIGKRFGSVAHIFRVGGDAFALLFAQGEGSPSAAGTELVEVCTAPFLRDGRNIFVAASVGVTLGADARDPLDLLKNAELALIQSKKEGGARASLYSRSMDATPPVDSVALESELRHAFESGQLSLYYQPIIRLTDTTVGGFEALLRWRHPTKGIIEPTEFIAHCEETGLIVVLGQFALETALRDVANWQRYFPLDPPLFVNVNLSRRQLRDDEFCTRLEKLVAASAIPPASLKLELTESAVSGDDDVRRILTRIRGLGVGLAIDDFGTGLSTLSQLRELPFDTVKIDKSFLARRDAPGGDADGDAILNSIVSLTRELKRTVVVEGVEREADANWLRDLGCEYAQGYFFAAALPPDEVLKFMARHHDIAAVVKPDERVSGASGVGG